MEQDIAIWWLWAFTRFYYLRTQEGSIVERKKKINGAEPVLGLSPGNAFLKHPCQSIDSRWEKDVRKVIMCIARTCLWEKTCRQTWLNPATQDWTWLPLLFQEDLAFVVLNWDCTLKHLGALKTMLSDLHWSSVIAESLGLRPHHQYFKNTFQTILECSQSLELLRLSLPIVLKYDPWSSSISSTWKLVRNANSRSYSRPIELQIREGAAVCVLSRINKNFRCVLRTTALYHSQVSHCRLNKLPPTFPLLLFHLNASCI